MRKRYATKWTKQIAQANVINRLASRMYANTPVSCKKYVAMVTSQERGVMQPKTVPSLLNAEDVKNINMQLSIFEAQPVDYSRGRHNELSKEAFEMVKPHISRTKRQILELLDGERCTYEIAIIMGKKEQSISGRFSEMRRSGLVEFVGKKNIKGSNYSIYKKI